MSESNLTLTIDGAKVTVPKGTLLVDAAKQVGIDIPIFCYHPKLNPVGMCRMCLVEIGRPIRDRSTGEFLFNEAGQPIIQFGSKLETACTTKVEDGWIIRVNSEKAIEGRQQIVEFLLTSHPLDCPVCDKGGECPLQNLTMAHGPGKSRFIYDDKKKLDKNVLLGGLIVLDRERCIQCSRCIRFQEEIAGDPVIEFTNRGRDLEITTFSDPDFDSYFSGNTTDICPVGALTTEDFRFGARPWELNFAASICPHCSVGCNIIVNTRREAKSGGAEVVKRVMPRQNEWINEIWICDKGRFGHTFAKSPDRLSKPLIRENGNLIETTWDTALKRASEAFKNAGSKVVGITSGRPSNEDLFNFRMLLTSIGGKAYHYTHMAGGDLVQKIGVGTNTNLGDLGKGDAILVIATDLIEEAPIWWMRVKLAAERGATLIVANARKTRLDAYANHSLRYDYGKAVHTALGLLQVASAEKGLAKYHGDSALEEAGKAFKEAKNAIVFYGSEGLNFEGTDHLAQACTSLLSATKHIGRANNGLIAVWPQNNTQGAWDMGLVPSGDRLAESLMGSSLVYIMASDPFGDDPQLADKIPQGATVIVQELFHTSTVERAEIVFPAQSFIERDGTYTSGQRIVQRFFKAVGGYGECLPDWQIVAKLGRSLGVELNDTSAAGVMRQIAEEISDYKVLDYRSLARVEDQWPPVGDMDKYFGGTAYKNRQGLGLQLAPASELGEAFVASWTDPRELQEGEGFLLVPVTVLYDQGTTVIPSKVLESRLPTLKILLNSTDVAYLHLAGQSEVEVRLNGWVKRLPFEILESVPQGTALLPRSLGMPLLAPVYVELRPVD
ncbi:MAG: NADH dehydrogenase (quinone) subunit G [Chloroflexi bacterium RBG_16_48_8]|nr:MAG: NADH dehydrogenase (quinone) subunit G [Chloroflexi bacterium RBG_16_48_8]